MKQPQPITLVGFTTTFNDVWHWKQELERLHARIAPRFARPEPRRRALAFLKGMVSATQCKNGWQLAEHAGEAQPDGVQRLLNSALWDAYEVSGYFLLIPVSHHVLRVMAFGEKRGASFSALDASRKN